MRKKNTRIFAKKRASQIAITDLRTAWVPLSDPRKSKNTGHLLFGTYIIIGYSKLFFEVKSSPLVKRNAGNVLAKFRTTETATITITATRATITYDGAHPLCVDENHQKLDNQPIEWRMTQWKRKKGLQGGRSFVFWYCGTTNDERPLLATHVFRHV